MAASLVWVAGCAKTTSAGSAAKTSVPAKLSDEQRALNLQSFDVVWSTIRDKHFDPKLNGANWEAARTELRPQVEAATTMSEARDAMRRLIAKLGQTHFGIIPSEAYAATGDAPVGEESKAVAGAAKATAANGGNKKSAKDGHASTGSVGIELRAVEGKAIVTRVVPGSSAEQAGVKAGWELVAVGQRPVRAILEQVGSHKGGVLSPHVMQSRTAEQIASVPVGEAAYFGFLDDANKARVLKVVGEPQAGVEVKWGNLPPVQLELRREMLPGNIGYMYISIWFDPTRTVKFVQESMAEFKDANGIIIDVRGNPGGMGAMAMAVGSFFVSDGSKELGTLITRDYKQRFVMNPRPSPYKGPVAILVDELSMSTSEIFAGGMRDIGRARVFGTPTPGAALPSLIEKLPNGDAFQYAFANYLSASGAELEGKGVKPDEIVPLDRSLLLQGKDPATEAAIRWIATKPGKATASASQSH